MKKLIASLAMCFMLVGIGSGFAEALELQKHTWELGTEISHITYEEPGIMNEKGFMYGILGSYAYHDNLMLKAEGKFSFGWVDYSSPISGTVNDIPDYMLEFRGLGGYDFPILKATILTPYIGLGYRYLNDDLSIAVGGYERESSYFYSPIGIETITELDNGWFLGAILEYDYFWRGTQISHLSDVNPGYNNPENEQKAGYGLRGSIKLQKKDKFVIEPFIRYWNIGRSDNAELKLNGVYIGYVYGTNIDDVYEPKNNSTEFGIKFAAKF